MSGEKARRIPGRSDLVEVLRDHPDFRRLFFARNASLLGDWFNLLALFALLRELGLHDASTIGTIIVLKLIPATLFGPAAGVLADRLPRRAIMLTADLSRFFLVLLLFLTPFLGEHATIAIYALTLLQVTGQAFAEPARLAVIPNIVPPRLLGAANALGAVTWSLMFTLGAALGGVVTSAFGWRTTLVVDACTYLVSFALIRLVRVPPTPRADRASDFLTLIGVRDVLEALAYLRRAPGIAATLLGKSGWGLAGAVSLFLTLFGERVYPLLGRPDLGVAFFFVARGVGTALGPIISRRLTREEPGAMRRAIGLSFLVGASGYALFALVDSAWLAFLLVVLAHLGGSTIWVFTTVILQREVPDRLRGRIFATDLGLATLMISLTTWAFGALLDSGALDLRPATLVSAALLVVSGIAWAIGAERTRRTLSRPERGPEEAAAERARLEAAARERERERAEDARGELSRAPRPEE